MLVDAPGPLDCAQQWPNGLLPITASLMLSLSRNCSQKTEQVFRRASSWQRTILDDFNIPEQNGPGTMCEKGHRSGGRRSTYPDRMTSDIYEVTKSVKTSIGDIGKGKTYFRGRAAGCRITENNRDDWEKWEKRTPDFSKCVSSTRRSQISK
ncbi:hypothetical protein GEV33_000809 [Tenebrio molitor]|uniref:Uncharacterized protein n=1 Tax=Tenebrio molitor TaxID=7067 RepID=A0A8J6HXE8_TENMO|nr:hypothetical protein GEV33_000809 [Tenebrio molitor]